jgi:hypothetical protein
MTKLEPLYDNGSLFFKEFCNTVSDTMIISLPDGTAEAIYRNETACCNKTVRPTFTRGGHTEEVVDIPFNTTTRPFA